MLIWVCCLSVSHCSKIGRHAAAPPTTQTPHTEDAGPDSTYNVITWSARYSPNWRTASASAFLWFLFGSQEISDGTSGAPSHTAQLGSWSWAYVYCRRRPHKLSGNTPQRYTTRIQITGALPPTLQMIGRSRSSIETVKAREEASDKIFTSNGKEGTGRSQGLTRGELKREMMPLPRQGRFESLNKVSASCLFRMRFQILRQSIFHCYRYFYKEFRWIWQNRIFQLPRAI